MSQAPDGIQLLADRSTLGKTEDSSAQKSVPVADKKQHINKNQAVILDITKSNLLSTLVTQLRQHYQERLDCIILFGSYARGQATSDSDIDVLIVLKESVNPTMELQQTSQLTAQLCLDHNVLISRMFMSRSRYETEQSPLLNNIRREGILL
jgi:uncharacterized protein